MGDRQAVKKRSQLTLVDLAGSERLSKSEAQGQARKEAQHINKSLSALADVIAARGAKQAHVPYRNSKLTSLLEESLGGDSKTLMLVHCRPSADNIGETICTLNFASRVRNVEMTKSCPRCASKKLLG
jgi:kinesin family protein C2/C3|eukprot:COSAG01_NODE_3707_length_5773_cov_15.633239_3_plen_128_part_00